MLGRPIPDDGVPGRGYEVAHVGYDQWNGVAVASRVGIDDVQVGFDGQPAWGAGDSARSEARSQGHLCRGAVWSLYVPNGRTINDPHYQYKLEWLAALHNTAESLAAERARGPDRPGRGLEHRANRRGRGMSRCSVAPPM